jgi:hypothetical protein
MKKKTAASKQSKKPIDWDAVSERTRQRCNRLTDEQRERLEDEALQIIYGQPRKAPSRRG